MNSLYTLVVAIQVCMALVIIALVLVQHGKGADMGAAFGSGASGSLFGATGSSSFLSKATGVAATIFFCATLGLAYLGNSRTAPSSGVMSNIVQAPKVAGVPAADSSAEKTTETAPATSAVSGQPAPDAKAAAPATEPATVPATAPAPTKQADQIPK